MSYPFQLPDRPISHRNVWSFRVYMIPLWDFVPEWNSRPGTATGVNTRRGDSRWHDILWWYHVNKCRAMRGNRSELTPARKSPRCHVNSPYQGNIRILEKNKEWTNSITLQPSCGTLIMAFLDLDFELNSCPLAPSNLTAFLKLREFSSYQATEFLHLNVNICWAWLLSSCR